MMKDINQEMDCHQRDKGLGKADLLADEDSMGTSVDKAMECLQISVESGSAGVDSGLDSDHYSLRQLVGHCKTDQQIEKQINPTTDEKTTETIESLTTSTSKPLCRSVGSDAIHKVVINEINSEEVEEGYNSDSVYDSSPETDGNKGDGCDQLSDVTENQNNSLNAVVDSEPSLTTYPLKYKWQLWFWRADHGVKVVWEEALQRVCKPFDTVDSFWRLYHHIIPVRHLVPPSDYSVFKDGISPMWEDSHNINGGKWTLDFAKGPNRTINPDLDKIWLEVLLCLIGEGFNEFGEDICGAVVNIRSKEDRISVWTANATKSVSNLKIGEILKIRSGYEGQMKYEAHSTAQRIAEAKERLFGIKMCIVSKQKPKSNRRSCVF